MSAHTYILEEMGAAVYESREHIVKVVSQKIYLVRVSSTPLLQLSASSLLVEASFSDDLTKKSEEYRRFQEGDYLGFYTLDGAKKGQEWRSLADRIHLVQLPK